MRGDRPPAVGRESFAASPSSITRSPIGTRHRPVVARDTVATRRRPSALAASEVMGSTPRTRGDERDARRPWHGPTGHIPRRRSRDTEACGCRAAWERSRGRRETSPVGAGRPSGGYARCRFSQHESVHEVDELAIARPDRKVIVKAFRRLVIFRGPLVSSGCETKSGSPSDGG